MNSRTPKNNIPPSRRERPPKARPAARPKSPAARPAARPGSSGAQPRRAAPDAAGRTPAPPRRPQARRTAGKGAPSGGSLRPVSRTALSRGKPAVGREDIIREDDIIRVKGTIDRPLFVIVLVLLCIGSVMVFSASYAYALSRTGDSYFYIRRQIVFVVLGIILALIVSRFDIRFIRKLTFFGFMFTVVLLVVVLVYGIAQGSAQRWIEVPFLGTFQPSELMKLMLVLMLADHMDNNESKILSYKNEKNGNPRHDKALFWKSSRYGVIYPLLIIIVVCGLVMLERHMSGTIILFLIGTVVIFAGGAMIRWLAGGTAVVGILLSVGLMAVPYMRKRLDMFLRPELYDVTNDTWQTMQGLIAVGSGGLLGVGLGQSRQKHMFVSQPQNDFIFSIICEELGFIGAVAILTVFAALIWRGITVAMKSTDTFSRLSAIGITGHIAIQTILNVMVVTNLIPNTGISLPFFSYGGSSLMCLMLETGVLLCISKYSYQQK